MIKKIRATINKLRVKRICIDDFAIKKRHKYAIVMIDIENHKIVDIIESRKDRDVATWLKTFPNLELVSRDGALCYRNAINEANKDIIQVTDRFHLLKNLTSYCKEFLLKNFNKFIYLNKNEEQLKEIELYEKYKLFIDKKII